MGYEDYVYRLSYLQLPDEVGNITINELMNHPDSMIIKKGNRISVRRQTDFGMVVLEISTYSTGRLETMKQTISNKHYKKEYRKDIIEMKAQGMTQKDIAFELGISPSYVSLILKEEKENNQ